MKRRVSSLNRLRNVPKILAALVIASCIWLPCMHLIFRSQVSHYRQSHRISNRARELAAGQIEVWSNPKVGNPQMRELRKINPEWDFMSRTYLVLSLANMALSDKNYRKTACDAMNAIIDDTLMHESKSTFYYYLLSYAHERWEVKNARSIFVDGEIALMLASRRMVEDKPAYKPLLKERVNVMIRQMKASPVLCAESYPDECWIFCNTIALAAIRMSDVLDGTDHSEFLASWINTAKKRLVDPKTGLLISAFAVDGRPAPCGASVEGSSIWMASHMLQIVDEKFAKQQYRLARKALGDSILGFDYAREWPRGSKVGLDIDSGPIAPLLEISPSSTGLASVAAAAFGDIEFHRGIFSSIEMGALPVRHHRQLRYGVSNHVGDAVLLYAMTEGPLWNAVQKGIH